MNPLTIARPSPEPTPGGAAPRTSAAAAEFSLLALLARNRGRLMTHRDLLVSVWGAGHGDDTQVLRANIANLRRKLDRAGAEPSGEVPGDEEAGGGFGGSASRGYIRTDAGVGYRFAA